ncbi:IS200/IS605 family accessory protein TnpB-related protein [Sporosarcina sp. E16_3]|uniref:IS200/IS605 family accessory protein TnpB-related protein n=1 Tax=Sporosarcina sp. E16_3 TaxID=2789293 RepID=UPI001A90E2AF|nr:IS200/IS605 family accessory protein TnpB-related protein [Sporosarcina sp. E16_3]MBO0600754.1 IS200/IS605 family accessory protein TnpB-related protein [Sporosarcina sp. E16_3]
MFRTYQTKLKNGMIVLLDYSEIPVYVYFQQYAKEFGRIERRLFVDVYVRKKPTNQLKVEYCANYQLTAMQYNSIKNQLDGRVSSKKEVTKLHIEETKEKIYQTRKFLTKKIAQKEKAQNTLVKMRGDEPSFLKKVNSYRKLKMAIHQKKRKLHRLQVKMERLECDEKCGVARLCFGSKKLFHKQFHLTENDLSFEQWKNNWEKARASQFTFIGSKDETYGNQSCTYDLENQLRIRVNRKDEGKFGKYIVLSNIHFTYGQENIDKAKVPTIGYTKGKGNKVRYYRALTCKFIFKNRHWYLNMSVDVDTAEIKTLQNHGQIGVDFNASFLAVTDVDRFGNHVHSFQVPFKAYHVSTQQAKQSLSDALKRVVDYAVVKQKPIAHEKLDFKKKKQQLKQLSNKQAKVLSGFAYTSFQSMLTSKCQKDGIAVVAVNPAYTSQIGQHKFMKKYGLSSHGSAAMVIARRGLELKKTEQVPTNRLIQGNQDSIILKKRFEQWKELSKQWKSYTFGQKIELLYHVF